MSPARAAAFRAALEEANRRSIRALANELRRELATFNAEVAQGGDAHAILERHRRRLLVLLARRGRVTAVAFGRLGRAMLASAGLKRPQTAAKAEPSPEAAARAERVRPVLLALAEALVGRAAAKEAAERLARSPALVAAADAFLALHGGDVARAAASLAGSAEVAAAATEALSALPGEGGGASAPPEPPAGPPPGPPPQGGRGEPRRLSFGERVEAHVREWAPRRARSIAATSGKLIAESLQLSARLGEGEEAAARRLQKRLAEVTLPRARRIARTEIGAAQNFALLASAEGRRVAKIWAAIDDARTRPTHHDADGQRVALGERFHVGEALLLHPGDPEGPPGEVINCRCAMLLEPLD